MKKIFAILTIAAAVLTACTNDDQYSWEEDFADLTATDTINIAIAWSGSYATVTGDSYGYVTTSGADVTVRSATNKFLQLTLSGSSTDGSLMLYSWKKLGVVLNGLDLTNTDGPAINNQCGKSFIVKLAAGTTNTLADGTTYAAAPISESGDTLDQKGTLFSEGQIYFEGTGSLTINAAAKNGIASDDYVVFNNGNVTVNVATTGSLEVYLSFTEEGALLVKSIATC